MTQRIAFVGGGHMATSLIGGLVARGTPKGDIVVAEPVATQRDRLLSLFGVDAVPSGVEAVRGAAVVVLAVKPQQMAEVARSIAPVIAASRPLVISIAAGIRLADLARWLGEGVPLIRAMPNRPALIGAGVSALHAGAGVTARWRETGESILAACGPTVWVQNEEHMDIVTAVSGSGPAYFFMLIEALEAAAVELGLDPATARTLSVETANGAGRMAAASGATPTELREQVTSKGGTTAAAIEVLETAGLRAILARAVAAATRRSNELARDYGAV
jgi:pyrroline-5-carboxylate reductase